MSEETRQDARPESGHPTEPTQDQKIRWITAWIAVVGGMITMSYFVIWIFVHALTPERIGRLAEDHFPGMIGIPIITITSLAMVVILRATDGPIEFEAPGFKFKGASGPLVLWVLVFLAGVAGMHVLW